MKKFLLVSACLLAITVKAHMIGGGTGQVSGNNSSQDFSGIRDIGYLNFSAALPEGKFVQGPTTNNLLNMYNSTDGMGAQTGFGLDIGGIFYFRKLNLPKPLHIGIDVTYGSFTINSIDWSSLGIQNYIYNDFFSYLIKIGPVLTYSPNENIYFDFCPKVGLGFSLPGGAYSNDAFYGDPGYVNITGTSAFSAKGSLGLNIRVYHIYLGMEYLFGSTQYAMSKEYTDSNDNIQTYYFKGNTNTNLLLLKFGFYWNNKP